MSKYSGLSQLADVATEMISPAFAHYPVRRKGERRRLNPNQAGIDWLEGRCTDGEDFLGDTEIVRTLELDEFNVLTTRGGMINRNESVYVRPMLQLIPLGDGSGQAGRFQTPCPDCDDWSRTSKCQTHHDLDGFDGLVKGSGRRRAWVYQRTLAPHVTIQVNGETLQGAREVSFHIEGREGRGEETFTYRF